MYRPRGSSRGPARTAPRRTHSLRAIVVISSCEGNGTVAWASKPVRALVGSTTRYRKMPLPALRARMRGMDQETIIALAVWLVVGQAFLALFLFMSRVASHEQTLI